MDDVPGTFPVDSRFLCSDPEPTDRPPDSHAPASNADFDPGPSLTAVPSMTRWRAPHGAALRSDDVHATTCPAVLSGRAHSFSPTPTPTSTRTPFPMPILPFLRTGPWRSRPGSRLTSFPRVCRRRRLRVARAHWTAAAHRSGFALATPGARALRREEPGRFQAARARSPPAAAWRGLQRRRACGTPSMRLAAPRIARRACRGRVRRRFGGVIAGADCPAPAASAAARSVAEHSRGAHRVREPRIPAQATRRRASSPPGQGGSGRRGGPALEPLLAAERTVRELTAPAQLASGRRALASHQPAQAREGSRAPRDSSASHRPASVRSSASSSCTLRRPSSAAQRDARRAERRLARGVRPRGPLRDPCDAMMRVDAFSSSPTSLTMAVTRSASASICVCSA